MAEHGDPIDHPAIYRTLIFAFAVWAGHFALSYGAVLIFPEQAIARWIAGLGFLIAAGILAWWTLRIEAPRPVLLLGTVGIALAAIAFGTFPAIVG